MRKVFIERLPGVPLIPLLYPTLGREVRDALLFLNEAFNDLTEPFVELVDDPAAADDLLIPHNYSVIRRNTAYLRRYEELSRRHGKRVIVFWHGDGTEEVALSHCIVFRTSQYRSTLRKNEVIMPAYTDDLLKGGVPEIRHKGEVPVIGFCGWAGYKNPRNRLWTLTQSFTMQMLSLCTGSLSFRARTKGLALRRAAIRRLAASPLVRTNFLIRDSYSGHRDTIRIDPVQGRREYVDTIRSSDLALTIRGDGNYSLRFYEALSMGRVPLFLDTESVLPLEHIIDYAAFTVRVPLADLSRMDQVAAEFWRGLTDEKFAEMQRRAREAFTEYLSVKAFLTHAVHHFL